MLTSRNTRGLVVLTLLAGALMPTPAARAAARTETVVAGGSPITSVVETEVAVRIPLPASAGPRPSGCDWLRYLRYRDRGGPVRSEQADRILIAQPGILEGAGAFDSVARNTVADAARRGSHIEFWALDRRSNCLEDRTGIRAGLAAGDVRVALDYYYHGRAVGDRRFAGFLDDSRVGWLARVGLEQTVRDEYDLLVAELPDQATRERKVHCGGHSLGGVITGYFAVWDFDGDRRTTADAGYRQCAGYFALDTTISTSLADLSGATPDGMLPDVGLGYALVKAGLESGVLPRTVSASALINAETMNLLAIAGLAARTDPDGETLQPALPSNPTIDTTQRILFSKDFQTFLTGTPSARDFRMTNAAVLGSLLDDNSQPLSFMAASAGFFDGGRIADKDFPVPADLTRDPALGPVAGLLGDRPLGIPDEPDGPLYTWRNYDRIGAPDDPAYRTSDGELFSTPAEEVTDLAELARSFAEHPLDFTEQYFPTRLVTDIQLHTAPEITRFVAHPRGLTANPVITLLAGNGLLAGRTLPPEHNVLVAPGYEHLDVLTAAPVQHGGRPEIVSTALARFAVAS
ncbi:hypothetical protein QLQ12_42110 [Actinoplanes sp. NEAU-A12]|uniref:Uncharacterized protein n=2 Tax=Actinoplanes sandaracinus TaxID=3045177 RepID=A0ABT6X021_9ACTN|nr:hypothetical protein [Actinoplanes sandaracinus]